MCQNCYSVYIFPNLLKFIFIVIPRMLPSHSNITPTTAHNEAQHAHQ